MVERKQLATAQNKSAVAPIEDIRKYAFRALLDDLGERESIGLTKAQCDLVKVALGKVASAATEVPDGGFFRGTILSTVEDFNKIYSKWNGHEGGDPQKIKARQTELRRLRKARQRMSKRIHLNQYVLQTGIDLQLVGAINDAFAGVVKSGPEIFKNLAKALSRLSGH